MGALSDGAGAITGIIVTGDIIEVGTLVVEIGTVVMNAVGVIAAVGTLVMVVAGGPVLINRGTGAIGDGANGATGAIVNGAAGATTLVGPGVAAIGATGAGD